MQLYSIHLNPKRKKDKMLNQNRLALMAVSLVASFFILTWPPTIKVQADKQEQKPGIVIIAVNSPQAAKSVGIITEALQNWQFNPKLRCAWELEIHAQSTDMITAKGKSVSGRCLGFTLSPEHLKDYSDLAKGQRIIDWIRWREKARENRLLKPGPPPNDF